MTSPTSDRILVADEVWKKYSKDLRRTRRYGAGGIAGEFSRRQRAATEELRDAEFWALSDVSFEVGAGEAFGILGANGAGKSTLLRIAAGISRPDRGRLELAANASSLLDPSASFDPMLSGRENIDLAFSLWAQGGSPSPKRLESIIEFAQLGDFIDTPVRTYSKGMRLRLGFAVLIHLNSRLILIDEALAVGDTGFQRRCLTALQQFCHRGGTLVFVTHSLALFNVLATRALYLKEGEAVAVGEALPVAQAYLDDLLAQAEASASTDDPIVREAQAMRIATMTRAPSDTSSTEVSGDEPAAPVATSQKPVRFETLSFSDGHGNPPRTGEPFCLHATVTATMTIERWQIGVTFWTPDLLICPLGVMVVSPGDSDPIEPGSRRLDCVLPPLALTEGQYACRIAIVNSDDMELVGESGFEVPPTFLTVSSDVDVRPPTELGAGQPLTILQPDQWSASPAGSPGPTQGS